MCGCGRTLMASAPGANSAGPIWSRKMNGPTIRREWKGSTRPTSNPPRSLRRASITSSIMVGLPADPAAEDRYPTWGVMMPRGRAVTFFTPRVTMWLSQSETMPSASSFSRRNLSKACMSEVMIRST